MRERFQEQLGSIERRIVRELDLAGVTLDALSKVVGDPASPTPSYLETDARRLRDGAMISKERLVVSVARQAPVAGDLRLVLALLQATHHLDHFANQFELITAQLMEIDPDEPGQPEIGRRLSEMARRCSGALAAAADAFTRRDVQAAEAVGRDDDVLDRLNREVYTLALAVPGPTGRRGVALHQMLIARSLERVGDNAVDIAEQAAFLATGEFREFADASHPRLTSSEA
jgi:phosphate transport system protein